MLLQKNIEKFIDYLKSKERSPETSRGYLIALSDFQHYIERQINAQVYLDEITVDYMESYLEYRKQKGDQPVSRNRAIYIFRSFYNYLVKMDLVEKNLGLKLDIIQAQKKESTYLLPEEVEILIEAMNHDLVKVVTITLANTGLRVSELCNLTLDDVDLKNRLIKVHQGKGNKDRTVPINSKLDEVLKNYLDNKRPLLASKQFFATAKTGRLGRQTINDELSKTTAKLGWTKHVTAHILRHSFASALVRKNVPLPAVQSLLGHSDLRVTSRYIHQDLSQLRAAVNLI